jgi:hypothetical protein
LYLLEVGDDHEILRKIKHGFCAVLPNGADIPDALPGPTQERTQRRRLVKVPTCYEMRKLDIVYLFALSSTEVKCNSLDFKC